MMTNQQIIAQLENFSKTFLKLKNKVLHCQGLEKKIVILSEEREKINKSVKSTFLKVQKQELQLYNDLESLIDEGKQINFNQDTLTAIQNLESSLETFTLEVKKLRDFNQN